MTGFNEMFSHKIAYFLVYIRIILDFEKFGCISWKNSQEECKLFQGTDEATFFACFSKI